MSTLVQHNSEILFLYDAKLCNPNGDPDEENRPRMDYATQTNLVSDVRLKRYLRDYFQAKGFPLYIAKTEEGETVTATERLRQVLELDDSYDLQRSDLPRILEKLVDIRLFGATIPWQSKKGGRKEGKSFAFTGAVQFSWGYSLNRAYLVESPSITSHLGSEEAKEMGTIGKDYRIKYSLIAFYGVVSAQRAKHTQMGEADLALLDEAMVHAIPLAATRSKIGQTPRLYLRIEHSSPYALFGDLRAYVKAIPKEGLQDDQVMGLEDLHLSLEKLAQLLQQRASQIQKVIYYQSDGFSAPGWHDITGLSCAQALEG